LKLPFIARLTCWLIVSVLGTLILIYTKDFLLPIVISSLLALLLYPVYKKLLHWKVPNALSVIISLLLVIIVLFTVILLASKEIGAMISNVGGLAGKINLKFSEFQDYLSSHFESSTLTNIISNAKDKLLVYTSELVSSTITGTTNFMTLIVLIIVYVFCFLIYNHAFKDFAFTLMSSERQDQALSIIEDVQKLVRSYLLGLVTVILIVGTLNTIGLLIIGIDNALFFAFLTAFLTVIPYIGITIGALVTAFYALLTKDTVFPAVAVVSVLFTIQLLESNLITPRIVGSRVSVNPFVAIVVLLIGGQVWGLAGMILSVPMVAILKVFLDASPSTQKIGYFLGKELTTKKVLPPDPPHEKDTKK
jgi:predicted PurR-regulated permease PerM